jgi:uncharacterized membrane protein YdjX (TVP38/TMEM64 family)
MSAPQASETTEGPPTATSDRRPSWGRWALLAAVAATIAAFYLLGLHHYFSWDYLRGHFDALQAQVGAHLPLSVLVFFLVYVTATALSLPIATWLTLTGAALFGLWLAAGVVLLAATLGASLAFLGSRYLFRDAVQRRFGSRLESLNAGLERDGAFYLFALRLAPVVPFFLINLGMGLTRLRVATFAGVSLIGMVPGTLVYAYAGTALADLLKRGQFRSPADVLSPELLRLLFAFALLGVVPLILRKLVQWRRP